ncbi:hypothetical protein SISSUDRAFT_1048000 [Sistotremastrum suecicum HHB10207 ss-3]|uniref:F-box domain-containing protein n=1 Tax=Sistotremastrum suecicum HHB10207 ss-3 TaxID=1314776 RepID=A0A166CTH0_9AGAM|nr:hypothetical protein SISSUDRAFT_1048000 [Sistotremastrum suecicum HHB10207 ss-3]
MASSGVSLPVELVIQIITHAATTPRNIGTTSSLILCCHTFRYLATPYLYRWIILHRKSKVEGLIQVLQDNPSYREYIERVSVLAAIYHPLLRSLLDLVQGPKFHLFTSNQPFLIHDDDSAYRLPPKLVSLFPNMYISDSPHQVDNVTHLFVKKIHGGLGNRVTLFRNLRYLAITCFDPAGMRVTVHHVEQLRNSGAPLECVIVLTMNPGAPDELRRLYPEMEASPFVIMYMPSDDHFEMWRDAADGVIDIWEFIMEKVTVQRRREEEKLRRREGPPDIAV